MNIFEWLRFEFILRNQWIARKRSCQDIATFFHSSRSIFCTGKLETHSAPVLALSNRSDRGDAARNTGISDMVERDRSNGWGAWDNEEIPRDTGECGSSAGTRSGVAQETTSEEEADAQAFVQTILDGAVRHNPHVLFLPAVFRYLRNSLLRGWHQ